MKLNIMQTIQRYRDQIEDGEVITIALQDAVVTLQPGQDQAPVDVLIQNIDERIDIDRDAFMEDA
ncbi:hypothetical protein [Natribacillus halophilus]|uniref:Uncharacterized protein n=1 Tax=Natribacillus halophilus TaxID=549003 RepID=A0A1G8KJE5_9BACI|nr:hypothetical protein [Natribacillus halophilus]SDI43573.1 hypothetical protein SAMN04488123_102144 [Natribacillus halophilus]